MKKISLTIHPPVPLLIIVGPTASGKSNLAVKLAQKLAVGNGAKNSRRIAAEIISADSRQVYKGLDIGTGKITRHEMRDIPHHLLDLADPQVPANSPRHFTVEKWRQSAETTIMEIHARGRLPIICGGTGFYISALVDGIKFPDVPPDRRLRERLAKKNTAELFRQLKKLDSRRTREMRRNGDWKNPRRLIRAIEIATVLGKIPKMPGQIDEKINQLKKYDLIFIGITLPAEILKNRIKKRLKNRIERGMIAEVKDLNRHGLSWKRMDELGLEYRFISRYLRGPQTADHKRKMTADLSSAIWHYAKRQMAWWKRDRRIIWMSPEKALQIFGAKIKKC